MAKPGPHKHTKRFMLAFGAMGALFLAWIIWLFVDTRLEHSRNVQLVIALENHFDKTGRYPDRLEELGQSQPEFDLTPYKEYDQSAECVRAPSYCRKMGEYVVTYPDLGGAFCQFRLGVDVDFICSD
jgi:hypothetical protein